MPEVFKFPTLRKVVLTPEKLSLISEKIFPYSSHEFGKIIYTSVGTHITHEGPSGGIFSMGEKKIHPVFSFEVQLKAFNKLKNKKSYLYLLVWVGGYTKGAVYHCGWQYPHCIGFDEVELSDLSKSIYKGITNILYDGMEMDKDVLKFNSLVK